MSLLACIVLLAACSLPTATSIPPTETSTSTSTAQPTESRTPTWTADSLAPMPIPTDGLVAYYPFDGDAADASGHGNDGSLSDPTLIDDRFESADSAYYFDGENDYILVPQSESFGLNDDFSVALWMNPSGPSFSGPLIFRLGFRPPLIEGWALEFNSKYLGSRVVYNPISSATHINAGLMMTQAKIRDSVWTCLAFTYHASDHTWSFYVHGRLNNQGSEGEETVVLKPSAQLYIGGDPDHSYYFHGGLDDIAIYQRTLADEDVSRFCAGRSNVQVTDVPIPTSTIQPTGSPTATPTRTPTRMPTVQRTPGCDGGFSRLAVGGYAILTEGTAPNRVRSEPELDDDNIISLLYTGATVKILGGPVCVGRLVFWKVTSTTIPGGSGWTAEGDGRDYYLAPYEP